jgi:hypothetical protein
LCHQPVKFGLCLPSATFSQKPIASYKHACLQFRPNYAHDFTITTLHPTTEHVGTPWEPAGSALGSGK